METIHLEKEDLDYMIHKASRFGERFVIHSDHGDAALVSIDDLEALQPEGSILEAIDHT